MSEREKNLKLTGHVICEGLAIGQAFIHHERLETLADSYSIDVHQVEEELRRIERATEAVAADLRVSSRRIESETNAKLAAIFETHEAMLRDPVLQEEIRELVEQELISAEHALARVFRRRENKFRQMGEQIHRQHADDVADLAQRVLREMAGVKVTPLEKMPEGRVLVARRLLPSDTVALPERGVAGIVAEFGGPGSHVALLAEALGIPTVAQIPELMAKVGEQDWVLVDGFSGEVVVNPDAASVAQHQQQTEGAQARLVQLIDSARQPACTGHGTSVTVLANVSRREDTATAAKTAPMVLVCAGWKGFICHAKLRPRQPSCWPSCRPCSRPWQENRSPFASWILVETNLCRF